MAYDKHTGAVEMRFSITSASFVLVLLMSGLRLPLAPVLRLLLLAVVLLLLIILLLLPLLILLLALDLGAGK